MSSNLSSLVSASDPGEAMKKLDGTYKDNSPSENEQMSRLPLVSIPQGSDPKPFTIKSSTQG